MFCAGADLKAVNAGKSDLGTKRGGFAGFVYRERRKPIIVAVDGLATAGGCEIVLAADLVVATTRSSFGLAEVKRNLVAGAGGLFRLPRAIGQAAAMEAILTGEPIPAERAYALGLVSRLVEPGEAVAEARRLADQITLNGPVAVWESRAVVRAAASEDDETLKKMTDDAIARDHGLGGPQGGPHRVHREAGPAVEGPLTAGQRSRRRHGDQAGRDARPARRGSWCCGRPAGRGPPARRRRPARATSVASSSRASPKPSSRASGVTYTWSTWAMAPSTSSTR